MANYNDEAWRGMKFNQLTVMGFELVEKKGKKRWNWICRCDCGELRSITPSRVLTGHNVSCGCHKREALSEWNKTAKLKHGGSVGKCKTRLYHIWMGMRARCSNPNLHDYPNYGGRGIKVCEEWKNSFEAFRDWANNNGYADKLSLDRIDVNGDYCPSNCKWATMVEQQRNRQSTERYEYLGKMRTLAEISEMTGINYNTLFNRIKYYGWRFEDAIKYKDGRCKDYRKYKKEKQA